MSQIRQHGFSPFSIACLHGGPGAPGSVRILAEALGTTDGVLEPFQTADTIDGLVEELADQLKSQAQLPVTLIGHSWGAWLGFLFAAKYPKLVKKLILVGSGPFEESYLPRITRTRLERLGPEGKGLFKKMLEGTLKDGDLARIGVLLSKTDSFDRLPNPPGEKNPEPDEAQYGSIWKEAEELRRSGLLLETGKAIQCPVVAIHGDWDPHPAEGVQKPLGRVLKDFKFVLLKDCGHEPWMEKRAREAFLKAVHEEMA